MRGPLVFPDAQPTVGLKGLTTVRQSFLLPPEYDRLTILRGKLKTTADACTSNLANGMCPFSGCLLMLAAVGALDLFVASPSGEECFLISPDAFRGRFAGFGIVETISLGKFVVMRTLMLHQSLEVTVDGCTVLLRQADLRQKLGQRPTSDSVLQKVIREYIDEALSMNLRYTKDKLVDLVLRHEGIHNVTRNHIKAIARPLWPELWSVPGRHRDDERVSKN